MLCPGRRRGREGKGDDTEVGVPVLIRGSRGGRRCGRWSGQGLVEGDDSSAGVSDRGSVGCAGRRNGRVSGERGAEHKPYNRR